MILYNVTVNVEPEYVLEWLEWMKSEHIPEVMGTGFFVEHKLFRLRNEMENNGETFSVQYFARDMSRLNFYLENEAPRLRKAHHDKFGDKCVSFRTILETVD